MCDGLLLLGQTKELAGRGIVGPRLRTAAKNAGFNIEITDSAGFLSRTQIFEIIDLFVKKGIKFLGLSTSWVATENEAYMWLSLEFIKAVKLKYPHLLIITGGQQYAYRDIVSVTDFHFQGFSDFSFVEFLKYINKLPNNLHFEVKHGTKVIESNLYHQIDNPNNIETVFQKNDNFLQHQPLPIELSRGCIFRCTFCRHPFQGKKDFDSYQRTPESLASELMRNYELFGTTRYSILDDTMNDSMEKLHRLQKAIEIAKLPNFEFVAYIKPELLVVKPEMIPLLVDMGLRGAFLGIESFNNTTRKIIGKGTNMEKVKDAIHNLVTIKNQVQVHGSFIVGLPEETPDDVYETHEFLLKNRDNFIKSWSFQPLEINNDPNITTEQSLFDKQPHAYNYTFINNHKRNWTNQLFTYDSAVKIANDVMKKSKGKMGYAGWAVSGCWHIGMSDHEIQTGIHDVDIIIKLKSQMRDRATQEYNNYFKQN